VKRFVIGSENCTSCTFLLVIIFYLLRSCSKRSNDLTKSILKLCNKSKFEIKLLMESSTALKRVSLANDETGSKKEVSEKLLLENIFCPGGFLC